MLNRNGLVAVAGAAIFALGASASAQDTTRAHPRSTKRIPVAKEVGGEVVPRVDTVTVYRTDTLQMRARVDTVTVTNTNTVVRVDTVLRPVPFTIPQVGGFYFGIGGGSTLPAAQFNDSDHPGWRVEVPFGFDPLGTPFGIRFNLGYSRFEPHSWVSPLLNQAQVMNADADLKIRFVSVTPHSTRVQLYVVGGGSYNRYSDVLETNHGFYSIGDAMGGYGVLPTNPDHAWHSGFGVNGGGGVEIGKGSTNLFVEGRFSRFHGEQTNISNIPVVIGLSWY